MSRYRVMSRGIWGVFFFIAFSMYYLGIIFISGIILTPEGDFPRSVLSKADLVPLYWSLLFGVCLWLIGTVSALTNLCLSLQCRQGLDSLKNAADAFFCACITPIPFFAMNHEAFIRETFHPVVWAGLTAIFLFLISFHYFHAEKTRLALSGCSGIKKQRPTCNGHEHA